MPEPLPPWMNIMQPLNGLVWLGLFATLFACLVFLHVLNRIDFLGNSDPFILIALLLSQEKGGKGEWSDGLRIFFFLLAFACFTFMVAYNGSLFSCLAVPIIPAPIGDIFKQRT